MIKTGATTLNKSGLSAIIAITSSSVNTNGAVMSDVHVGPAEGKQSPHSLLMAPDKHLDGCNYCQVPKEMRDTRGPNKT